MHFDNQGNLRITEKAYIPKKHVQLILENYKQGKDYATLSPVYPVTRAMVAFIVVHNGGNDE